MKRNWAATVVKAVVTGMVAIALFGLVVMSLWNWLMPAIFGLRMISFWQALGLVFLSKILFTGFHGRMGGRRQWLRRMQERWGRMTPEQREKLRECVKGFCGPAKTAPTI
jgi:predicted membrane chloride channel (bestrophin family)